MSIIVAIAPKHRAGKPLRRVLAGDRRVSNEDGHKFDRAPKVYRLPSGLLGFAGSVEAEAKLRTIMRRVLDPITAEVKLPSGEYNALFLSKNGNVYQLACGKAALCENATIFCVGAAYQYAHGAIYGYLQAKNWKLHRLSVAQMTELARLGVRTAIEFNNTCGGRAQILALELP